MNKLINILLLFLFSITEYNGEEIPKIWLKTGRQIPVIGLGTWQTEGQEVVDAVRDALEAGYRHIDTAWLYQNEREVGKGLQQAINKGIVKRKDVFITTKVWPRDRNRKKAMDVIKNSLKLLNTSYVDLVLIHYPLSKSRYTSQVYKGLEDALKQNMVGSIGVSNFKPQEIEQLIRNGRIKPAMNQIRIHPGFNQDNTIEYCKQNNISVTAYSPLGTGSVLKDPILTSIGKKHNKSAAQVAIRWHIQRGLVVIPKSVHKNRIIENFDVFDFKLTDEEMDRIHSMPQKKIRDFWG